jgi:hypothetical protein
MPGVLKFFVPRGSVELGVPEAPPLVPLRDGSDADGDRPNFDCGPTRSIWARFPSGFGTSPSPSSISSISSTLDALLVARYKGSASLDYCSCQPLYNQRITYC